MKKIYTNLALVLAFMSIGFTSFAQNLVINPGGEVTVLDGSSIYVANGGQLIINTPGNSGAPGSLIDKNTTGGNITADGNVVFNRFLSKDEWHMITSPVQNMAVTGVIHAVHTSNNNMYRLDEPTYMWVQTKTGTMNENEGYLTTDNVYKTVAFEGSLYSSGAVTIDNASYTDLGNGVTKTGIHVIGNKFTSAIDLEEVTGTNVGATFYIYNANDYATYTKGGAITNGGSRYLAATQGFAYYVTDPVNSITIPQTAKVHNPVIFLKKGNKTFDNSIRMNVSGNNLSSEMLLYFTQNENTSVNYDPSCDAVKFFSWNKSMPGLYAVTEKNENLAVDVLPASVMENYSRSLGFKVDVAGTFTIRVSEFSFDSNFPVILEDTYTGQEVDLALNSEYTFTSAAGEFAGRFNLLFNPTQIPTGIDVTDGNSINVYTNKKNLHININSASLNNSRVEVYNLMGSKILDNEITSNNTVLNLNVETGNYIVKVISGIDAKVTKVFVD